MAGLFTPFYLSDVHGVIDTHLLIVNENKYFI